MTPTPAKSSLFSPTPQRKRGLALTVVGSLVFHGSLVGVAALWATHPAAVPEMAPVEMGSFNADPALPPAMPPDSTPTEALPVAAPTDSPDLVTDETLPPPEVTEPEFDLSTPVPQPPVRSKVRAVAPVNTARPQMHLPTGGLSSNAPGGPAGGGPTLGGRWNTPKPAYPFALRQARVQGSGRVRVTTNASGRVIDAVMAQSTGNARLDEATCQAAEANWSGPASATTTVPITFQLQ